MTTKEIELLIAQWGTDPAPPVLADRLGAATRFIRAGKISKGRAQEPSGDGLLPDGLRIPADLAHFSNGRNSGGSGPLSSF